MQLLLIRSCKCHVNVNALYLLQGGSYKIFTTLRSFWSFHKFLYFDRKMYASTTILFWAFFFWSLLHQALDERSRKYIARKLKDFRLLSGNGMFIDFGKVCFCCCKISHCTFVLINAPLLVQCVFWNAVIVLLSVDTMWSIIKNH